MTKLDKLKQAEHLYVYEKQPLDVIGAKLDLSRRTLFYWKKEYEWDKKRFEKGREQELFNRELLNLCLKHNIKRLIYVSSPSIYFDFKDKLNIKETELPTKHPANNYIKTKIIAENVIDNAFKDGLDVITIRPRGIFGSEDSAILPRLLKANREKFIPKTRKKDILTEITHVENVVESMILAMQADKKYSGEKYNITNDENIYLYKTLENAINKVGEKFNLKYIPYKLMFILISIMEFLYKFIPNKEPVFTRYSLGLLSFNQTLDISKAKKDLGYEPIISIEDGLKECLNG